MCIVVDICDTLPPLNRLKYYQNVVCVSLTTYVTHTLDIFFTFPPAGPQTKGLVKSLDFPTQLGPIRDTSVKIARYMQCGDLVLSWQTFSASFLCGSGCSDSVKM